MVYRVIMNPRKTHGVILFTKYTTQKKLFAVHKHSVQLMVHISLILHPMQRTLLLLGWLLGTTFGLVLMISMKKANGSQMMDTIYSIRIGTRMTMGERNRVNGGMKMGLSWMVEIGGIANHTYSTHLSVIFEFTVSYSLIYTM